MAEYPLGLVLDLGYTGPDSDSLLSLFDGCMAILEEFASSVRIRFSVSPKSTESALCLLLLMLLASLLRAFCFLSFSLSDFSLVNSSTELLSVDWFELAILSLSPSSSFKSPMKP